jgi:hypothetical protein
VKVGWEDILKPTVWNQSLHKIINDNGVKVLNFALQKSQSLKYNILTL